MACRIELELRLLLFRLGLGGLVLLALALLVVWGEVIEVFPTRPTKLFQNGVVNVYAWFRIALFFQSFDPRDLGLTSRHKV